MTRRRGHAAASPHGHGRGPGPRANPALMDRASGTRPAVRLDRTGIPGVRSSPTPTADAGHGSSCTGPRSRPCWSRSRSDSARARRRPATWRRSTEARQARAGRRPRRRSPSSKRPCPTPRRPRAVLELLREAYEAAARQAEADGQDRRGRDYRENLEILDRNPGPPEADPDRPPAPARPPATARGRRRPGAPSRPTPRRPVDPRPRPPRRPTTAPVPAEPARPPRRRRPAPDPAGRADPPPGRRCRRRPPRPAGAEARPSGRRGVRGQALRRGRPDLRRASTASGKLPADRRDHWAYCRAVDVVRRINARPGPPASGRPSTPRSSRSARSARRTGSPNTSATSPPSATGPPAAKPTPGQGRRPRLVARRAARRPPGPARPSPAGRRPSPPPARSTPRPAGPTAARIGDRVGRWQIRESANFLIFHADPAARPSRSPQAAEAAARRRSGAGRAGPAATWSPRCEIFLFPTADDFSRDDGPARRLAGLLDDGDERGPDHLPPGPPPRRPPERSSRRSCRTRSPTSSSPTSSPPSRSPAGPTRGSPSSPSPPPSSASAPPTWTSRSPADRLFQVNDLMAWTTPTAVLGPLLRPERLADPLPRREGTPAQFIEFVQAVQRDGLRARA